MKVTIFNKNFNQVSQWKENFWGVKRKKNTDAFLEFQNTLKRGLL